MTLAAVEDIEFALLQVEYCEKKELLKTCQKALALAIEQCKIMRDDSEVETQDTLRQEASKLQEEVMQLQEAIHSMLEVHPTLLENEREQDLEFNRALHAPVPQNPPGPLVGYKYVSTPDDHMLTMTSPLSRLEFRAPASEPSPVFTEEATEAHRVIGFPPLLMSTRMHQTLQNAETAIAQRPANGSYSYGADVDDEPRNFAALTTALASTRSTQDCAPPHKIKRVQQVPPSQYRMPTREDMRIEYNRTIGPKKKESDVR
jgi:hypothetical protein